MINCKTHSESLELLNRLGFSVSPDYKVCNNIEDIIEHIEYWTENRDRIKIWNRWNGYKS